MESRCHCSYIGQRHSFLEGIRFIHAEIADRKDEIAGICRHLGVSRLEVFGSAARSTDFDPETSDADFLVEFSPDDDVDPLGQFFDLVDALSGALGRPVDLIEEGAVTNPYLLTAINRSRELVYAA
ncbi:MAG: nucleotidyltransferase domain-containing protein [Albidovulum sp.]|nr:nucleotidyltransferase domain-containing protein [Albidovulum sp.]